MKHITASLHEDPLTLNLEFILSSNPWFSRACTSASIVKKKIQTILHDLCLPVIWS